MRNPENSLTFDLGPVAAAERMIETLKSLDVSFYANQLDQLALTDEGLQKYLKPLIGLPSPFERIYKFRHRGKTVCYYQVPKAASSSILESFLLLLDSDLTIYLSNLLVNELRNLYNSYIHQASKRYLTKSPVEDLAESDFSFIVKRSQASRVLSSVLNKIVHPFWNVDEYEPWLLRALSVATSGEAIKRLGGMSLSDLVFFSTTINDPHFLPLEFPDNGLFRVYEIDSLDLLASDLTSLFNVDFRFNRINVGVGDSAKAPSYVTPASIRPVREINLNTKLIDTNVNDSLALKRLLSACINNALDASK